MTFKELGYFREHRRQMMSNKNVQEADAMQTITGL